MKRPNTENSEGHITCPFCKSTNFDYTDYHDLNEDDWDLTECGDCAREFWVNRVVTLNFTTKTDHEVT